MPWLSIIVWLVSFLLASSKKSIGMGKAALLATGLALGTYFLADPSNPDNYLGLGTTSLPDSETKDGASNTSLLGAAGASALGSTATQALKTAGDVALSPAGQAGILSTLVSKEVLPWLLIGGLFLLASR